MERMINSFWWGSNKSEGRGTNWLSWERLSMRKEYGGLGFRHFHGFNLAILGKQGWKMTTNQDAIVTRVFKAKYFPKGDFVGARLGHNPSYVWRRIHTSQVVVRRSMRWQLGDGKSISVWNEPWLRDKEDPFIHSGLAPGLEGMEVNDLMIPNTLNWRTDFIQASFNARDATEILSINLSNCVLHDRHIWNFSNNGCYTVRSAYHLLMERVIDNTDLRCQGDWMALWKIKAPQKLLAWRALCGCLPTRNNLLKRGVDCSTICPQCERLIEDEWHAFFGCSKAIQCWSISSMWPWLKVILDVANSFKEAVFKVLNERIGEQKSDFITVLWCLWCRRNDKLWHEVELRPDIVVNMAREAFFEWVQVRSKEDDRTGQGRQQHIIKWTKPLTGEVKCNIDAAIFKEQGMFGIGMYIRDANGHLVRAKSLCLWGVPPAQEVEAIGLLEAIRWVYGLGFQKMSIELDCKLVVDGILGDTIYNSEFGSILDLCREELRHVPNYVISFIRRQANQVAHSFARASRNYASSKVFDLMSTCMLELFMNDMR